MPEEPTLKESTKKCFIITPIGSENSEIRRKARGVIDSVIKPVLKCNNFNIVRSADEMTQPGSISTQIIQEIFSADLVIANLTGLNPNVMYELAVRHAVQKPIIHICEVSTLLPFDIKDQRTIMYTDDMYGVSQLSNQIADMLSKLKYDVLSNDNPIYNSIKIANIIGTIPKSDPQKIILERLESLENKLNLLVKSSEYTASDNNNSDLFAKLSNSKVYSDAAKITSNYSSVFGTTLSTLRNQTDINPLTANSMPIELTLTDPITTDQTALDISSDPKDSK